MIYLNENIKIEGEKIRTLRPNGKEGVLMLKHVYDSIRTTILTTLYIYQPLAITELLDKCLQKNSNNRNEVSWFILQVKLDLETRGLLKSVVTVSQREKMLIKLTRLGQQQLPQEARKLMLKESRITRKADTPKTGNSMIN